MDESGYANADLGEFQKQLSDMVVTYQQLPEGEQPAAYHLLQASLGPLLDYGLTEVQSGQHLIIADQQHSGAPDQHHSGAPDQHHSGAPDQQHSGAPDQHHSGAPDQHHSGTPDQHHSGAPDQHHSGTLDQHHSGALDHHHSDALDQQHSDAPDQHHSGVPDQHHTLVQPEHIPNPQHHQHLPVGQEQMITNHIQKISGDRDSGREEPDDQPEGSDYHMTLEQEHSTQKQEHLVAEENNSTEGSNSMPEGEDQHDANSLTISKDVAMVSCEAYPAAAAEPAAAAAVSGLGEQVSQQLPDGTAQQQQQQQQQWGQPDPTAAATAQGSELPAAAAVKTVTARRPVSARYVCPAPGCGQPCGHRKALVLHVKWEHLTAPVCCRACRTELNTHAHFLYHHRTCFQGVSALVCPDCDARFTMELPYKRHLAGHALNACHKCGERLSSRKALVKHLRHEHKIRECEKWFSCDKCPKRFMKKRSWLVHTKVHATEDDVQCGRCGLTVSKLRLADHVKTEHGHEPFSCSTCHKRFRRNQQYLQHMRLHEQYDCSLCGQPFVTQSEYAAHMQSEHQVQPELLNGPALSRHRCEVCGATFWSQAQLTQHLDKHPDASLECSRCQTEFESASQLHRHLRRSLCSRSPQLVCHHCGAQFSAHFALRKHLARAHGEGGATPSRCPHCDYTNSCAANLRRHIGAHQQNARRYVCDQCAAAFHTLSTLKDHQLYVHTTEKRFVCAECQKAFKTSSSLNRHLRVHSETRPYQCYCGNSYKRMSHLRRHMTAVHNVRTRTRLIERLDGSAAGSSDSGSDAAGSTGGGGGGGGSGGGGDGGGDGDGGGVDGGGGDGGGGPAVPADEAADWAGLVRVSDQGMTYITDDSTLLRVYPVGGDGEELAEGWLPHGVYSTDTVFLPDGSRSIVLKPAGQLGGAPGGDGGGSELAAETAPPEPSDTLPPPSTIRSPQQGLV